MATLTFRPAKSQFLTRDERAHGCMNDPKMFDKFDIEYPADTPPQCDGGKLVAYYRPFDDTRYVLCATHRAYLEGGE